MAVRAIVDGFAPELEVVDYSVRQDTTPLSIGDSAGSVGEIRVRAVAKKTGPILGRTDRNIDRDIILIDDNGIEHTNFLGRGSAFGHIKSISEPGGVTTLTAETLIARLNTDRTAPPFYGRYSKQTRVTYLVNMATNPSLETNSTNWGVTPGTTGAISAGLVRATTAGWAKAGTYVGQATWTTAATAAGGGLTYTHSPLSDGDTITASAYLRTNRSAGQVIRMSLEWLASVGGATVGTTVGETIFVDDDLTSTYRVSATGVAPAGATALRVTMYNYNDSSGAFSNWAIGDILAADALMITTTTAPIDYFDGDTTGASWTGVAHQSTSIQAVEEIVESGYDATVAEAFRFYCGLVGITPTAIHTDAVFEQRFVTYPAWTGNVWNYIKMMCAAEGAEVALVGQYIELRQPRIRRLAVENKASFVKTVDTSATAQFVQIMNYNNRWLSDSIVFQSDSVLTVDAGSFSRSEVSILADLDVVNNPVPLAAVPEPYIGGGGVYVIIDSNGTLVSPSWWTSSGGSITATILPEERKLEILIVGPRGAGSYTGPFRIADASGDPALIITGTGVFTNPETLVLATGAGESQTSNVYAPAIQNPFVSSEAQAIDRGFLAAQRAGGPVVTITGSINTAAGAGQEFGLVEGSRIYWDEAIYRINSATYGRSKIEFTATMDVTFNDMVEAYGQTFDEFNIQYGGYTFTGFNALFPTQTLDQFNALSPQPTFDDINLLYDGMTFNDQAVYPLVLTTSYTQTD